MPAIYDIAGVGFGPANLALAIAVTEDPTASAIFLERQPQFGWHRGMLIDDATMQVSFLKDLVTLRNPASPFTFLCYLQQRGRLLDFINQKTLFPLRIEYHDYLDWAASKVNHLVRYDQDVTGIVPVMGRDRVDHFEIHTKGAKVYARNLVLATGLVPALPDGLAAGDRIWHSSDLLTNVNTLDHSPGRFIVVGSGQSAAEVTAFLHERYPGAQVRAVVSRYGYSPADDSPFANRIFDPGAVDDFFHAPAEVKQLLYDYHGNTNYSVVDSDLINELYRRVYREKVLGSPRLHVLNVSRLVEAELVEAEQHRGGVRATIESLLTGEKLELEADILVCATGYRPADPSTLLSELDIRRDERGRLRVDRDYRVQTRVDCGIYLQGGTEHSHGITSSLLSNTAVRAGEILQSVLARRGGVS